MQTWVVICWAIVAVVGADECPDGGRCAEGQTCCSSPTNSYGCCPFDQAECCEDHIHCCPADTICDPEASRCVNDTVSIPWMERTSALQPTVSKSFRMIKSYMGEDDDNICPDQSRCPAEFSCLKTLTKFGCCPLAKGISCSDGKHCCPEGHHCSIDSRSCIQKERVTAVRCSDGVSECPDETTCCETPEGKWGCCPMPKAVCCNDKKHCCPEGTTCNIEQMKCISISTKKELPMWAKFPARQRADWENQNEGEEITAKTADEEESEKSIEAATASPLPPLEEEVDVSSVTKADGVNKVACNETAACPDGSTCCKTREGGWACCPLPEAVCCEDFVHCCPKGKKCNLAAGKCEDDLLSIPWFEKKPAISRSGVEVQVKDVPCDDTTACPDGTTCCKTREGGWACCPLPEAVCCEDFVHCCPKGKKCNLAAGKCEDDLLSIPWFEKKPAISRPGVEVQVKDVPCDDTTACPDGTTCCKTREGGWACCPLPEAVCCEDFVHCCPKGKKCNLAAGKCEDDLLSIPWFEKKPAISRSGVEVQVKNVPCDDTTACPDGTTCCKNTEGAWACCPLPKAVCCDDHLHCCPEGTTCNPTSTGCLQASASTSVMLQVAAFTTPVPTTTTQCLVTTPAESSEEDERSIQEGDDEEEEEEKEEERNQCDDHTSCPQDTTCCFMQSSQKWGCCPLPKAVCCADGSHCCPENYKCNEDKTTCVRGEVEIPWYTKLPAVTSVQVDPNNIQCDDDHQCPEHTSCCKLFTGEWGCCPLQNAVCCSDKEHCCPEDYTCDVVSNSCQKLILLQLETVPLTPVFLPEYHLQLTPLKHRNVQCDGQKSCPDDNTCCRTSATTWGCCPAPNAVCCSDMKHCCPSGYTCTEEGSCVKNSGFNWQTWDMFSTNKKRALIL
ncbi:granulin a [Gambusia affinis]|uniref:granulin a n=1 Tax=Gambusia affinis TaxID=33528 RepID=UPI001CDBBDDD|nr:granulin a [Gambusia affinis]